MSGLKIAMLRAEYQWTQSEVAKMLGITKGAYSNIETGKRKPSYKLIIQIQKVFQENIEILLKQTK